MHRSPLFLIVCLCLPPLITASNPGGGFAADPPVVAISDADATTPETLWYDRVSDFHGFDRLHFKVADRAATLVVPDSPAAGSPWVWRARFPDFHPEVDVKLLAAGYHIGYVDVAGMFGAPEAIEIGNAFYREMTSQRQLSPKPVMEGVSRGGLFVYNWLVANPSKVSAVYCDTPVCDVRSWPGGQGTGIGHATSWQQCLDRYGITAQDSATFRGAPVDQARAIAATGVKLLHIVTENDRVVPPTENTYVLRSRLEEHGGRLDVISVPKGTEKSKGHHFTHEAVDQVFYFVVQNTDRSPTESKFQPTEAESSERMALLTAAKRIMFLGDSITSSGQYVADFESWLRTKLPADQMPVIINAGLSSETVSGLSEDGHAGGRFPRPDVAERIDRVIETVQPDLVFVCYGMNCGVYKPISPERLKAYQDGMLALRKKLTAAGARIIHVTPPTYDDTHQRLDFSYNEVLGQFAQWLVAKRKDGWRVIDLHQQMTDELKRRRAIMADFKFARDGVHPSPDGHWVMTSALIRWFGDDLSADANTPESMMKNQNAPSEILAQVRLRMKLLRDAYVSTAGHKRPGVKPGLPLAEAIEKADAAIVTP